MTGLDHVFSWLTGIGPEEVEQLRQKKEESVERRRQYVGELETAFHELDIALEKAAK